MSPLHFFYKELMMDLVNRKINNDPTFEEKFDIFLSKVEKDSNHFKSLHDITQRLAAVASNLSYPDVLTEEKAASLYEDVAQIQMGNTLRQAASSMYQCARDGRIFDCYRLMFIQMEILFAYLDKTRDFADWASKKNSSTHPPKYPYTIGVNGVGVNSKPFVLNDYFKEHLDKTDNIVAISVIDMVKKMRNYASHGYHEDETARLRGTIRTAREKMDEFLEKWCEFLKFLASFLV